MCIIGALVTLFSFVVIYLDFVTDKNKKRYIFIAILGTNHFPFMTTIAIVTYLVINLCSNDYCVGKKAFS